MLFHAVLRASGATSLACGWICFARPLSSRASLHGVPELCANTIRADDAWQLSSMIPSRLPPPSDAA
eukprot:3894575-Pyramimonas_sp.AAC.1